MPKEHRDIYPIVDPPGVLALNNVVYRCKMKEPFSEQDTQEQRAEKQKHLQAFLKWCTEAKSPAVLHPYESTPNNPAYLVIIRKDEKGLDRLNKAVTRHLMTMGWTSLPAGLVEEWRATATTPPSSS